MKRDLLFHLVMWVLGVAFTGLGLMFVVMGLVVGGEVRLPFLLGGGLFVLIGLVPFWLLAREARQARQRARHESPGSLRPATPIEPTMLGGQPEPWAVPVVAGALAAALTGTPYRVDHNDHQVQIRVELADQSWWVLATRQHLTDVFLVTLTEVGTGRFARTDQTFVLEWQAGVPRLTGPALSAGGSLSGFSGRTWSYTRRTEFGNSTHTGLEPVVNYTFTTADINDPLRGVLKASGWRTVLDAAAHAGLVMGLIGASAAVLVPIGLGLGWLLGGFD